MKPLDEIEQFFEEHGVPKKEFRLDAATVIKDPQKFVAGSISFLKNNSGNPTFVPYYQRLHKYYQYVKSQMERKDKAPH